MDSSKFTLHLLHHTVNAASPTVCATPTTTTATTAATTDSDPPRSASPSDSDLFEQRLFDLSEQLSATGYSQPSVLSSLAVEAAVVGQAHLAFLLDTGHVCRLAYQLSSGSSRDG